MTTPTHESDGLSGTFPALAAALVVAIAVPLVLYFGVHGFLNSSHFLVQEVRVSGQEVHTRTEILAAAGLDRPRNLLTCRSEQMARDIEGLTWVREASVRRLRGRVLEIDVREARWRGTVVAGEPWLVDEGGEPIRVWRPEDGLTRPIVLGVAQAAESGGPPRVTRSAAVDALALAEAWGERFPEAERRVAEVEVLPAGRYRLHTVSGMEVVLARGGLDARLDRMEQILNALGEDEALARRVLLDGARLDRAAVRLGEHR